MASIGEQSEYTMGGVPVKFPCKPYRTQVAMMSKIVQALSRHEHALLESPTGSGKSLALLCSTLAWQLMEHQRSCAAPPPPEDRATNCRCECHIKVESQPPGPVAPPPTALPTPASIGVTTSHGTPARHAQSSSTPVGQALGNCGSNRLGMKPTDLQAQSCSAGLSTCNGKMCSPGKNGDCCNTSALSRRVSDTLNKTANEPVASSAEIPARKPSHCNPTGLQESRAITPEPGQVSPFKKQLSVGVTDSASRPQDGKSDGGCGGGVCSDGGKDSASCVREGQEAMEVGEEGSKLNDSLDDDFKHTKKRFRTPSTSRPNKKKRKVKGVVYEDGSDSANEGDDPNLCVDERGLPTWKIELKGEAATAGLGVTQSQIMDIGIGASIGNSGACGSGEVKTSGDGCCSNDNPTPNPAPNPSPAPPCPKCGCGDPAKTKTPNRRKCTRIYFGTRTHKQITQLVHEMGRTAYSSTPMCILASRIHTCIHPQVSLSKNKNDDCKRLLDYADGVSCSFYYRVQQKLGSQAQLRQLGYTTAWDIEDLVKLGKRVRACPYFATRGLLDEADIVFCPYNYLIDPMIREQMMVDLTNQVVILDEAHNMEDSAREAASLSVTSMQVADVADEIEEVYKGLQSLLTVNDPKLREDIERLIASYRQIQAMCKSMVRWIETNAQRLPQRAFEQACGIWSGQDFLPVLEQFGVTPSTFVVIQHCLKTIIEASSDSDIQPVITGSSLNLIKSVCMVISFLFKDRMKFIHDYRMSLMKTTTMRKDTKSRGGWKQRKPKAEKVWTYSLNFWCLNPAVAFSELTKARSIILTSGTLSPMGSFSSELGVAFNIQLEANHVIPESQTWVRSLSCGPHGKSLTANYQNSETYDFQDELGELILRVCQTVPYGVLCFLPSYKMLEKLTKRWQDTMLWDRVMQTKYIVSEPRSGEKIDFDALMLKFYDIIRESHPSPEEAGGSDGCLTGALFLAVCRGKVSEGLDFADNHARAVITVGIPFPNVKDKQVELKREYNNEHTHQRGLLTGSEWYEIQAYRALNQALGRCIRHKKDWGALILVDERFSKMHYTKGLSKWVRQRLQHQSSFSQAMSSLRSFAETMMKTDVTILDASTSLLEKSPRPSLSASALATSLSSTPLKSPLLRDPLSGPGLSSPSTASTPAAHVVPVTSTPIRVQGEMVIGNASVPPAVASLPFAANAFGPQDHPQGSNIAFVPSTSSLLQQSFHYPCGVQITSPNSKPLALLSLTDIVSAAMKLPLKMEGVESTDSADSRSGMLQFPALPHEAVGCLEKEGVVGNEKREEGKVKKGSEKPDSITIKPATTVPETPDQSPSIQSPHSPLLFDSCDSNSAVLKQTNTTSLLTRFKYASKNPTHTCSSFASNSREQVQTSPPPPPLPPNDQLSVPGERCTVPRLKQTPQKPEATGRQCQSTLAAVDRDTACFESQLHDQSTTQPLPHPWNAPQDHISYHGTLDKTLLYADADLVDDDDLTPPLSQASPLNSVEVTEATMSTECLQAQQDCSAHLKDLGDEETSQKLQTSRHHVSENKFVMPLGQPRRNVRMSTRRTAASSSAAEPILIGESEDEDTADFKAEKVKTPRRVKELQHSDMQNQVISGAVNCLCGKLLSKRPVTTEKMELKEALSKQLSHFKVHTIQTSRLWRDLKSGRQRRKGIPVHLVPASELSCSIREGSSEYNSVWDEKLGLCYSHLQCTKCGVTVGASIHCTRKEQGTLETLIGKAILPAERVHC